MTMRPEMKRAALCLAAWLGICACDFALLNVPAPTEPDPPRRRGGEGEGEGEGVDILFVIDNSGSMLEEQQTLAAAFATVDCPIPASNLADFSRCGEAEPPSVCAFRNPSNEMLASDLAGCGFLQILAARSIDYQIGVITTDVGICDNRFPAGQGGSAWGFRPQRGCLQPNGPPGEARKIIANADLQNDDGADDDLPARFTATLDNIRTFGTPIERGLDAARLFLATDTQRAAGCEGDRAAFRRDGAELVLIFVTDEEDCSRLPGDEIFSCPAGSDCVAGMTEFTDEVCDDFIDHFTSYPPITCYEQVANLTVVDSYVAALSGQERVRMVAIAGGISEGGNVIAAGCRNDPILGVTNDCIESCGNSSGPECRADGNCCTGDPGSRYFELVDTVGGIKGSICESQYQTLLAAVAAAVGT